MGRNEKGKKAFLSLYCGEKHGMRVHVSRVRVVRVDEDNAVSGLRLHSASSSGRARFLSVLLCHAVPRKKKQIS